MYANPCDYEPLQPGEDYVGLGFWSALIPIGVSVIGSAFGDDGSIDTRDYYTSAKSLVFCPDRGEDANVVGTAIANIDASSPEGGRLLQTIRANLATDTNWAKYGIAAPRTARAQAHVLVNGGNGWRYCGKGEPIGPKDVVQRDLVGQILAYDAVRRRTLAERAQAAAGTVGGAVERFATTEIIPGVSTPLLAIGALGLVLLTLAPGLRKR